MAFVDRVNKSVILFLFRFDLINFRKKYRKDAHHVACSWLVDCVKQKRLLSVQQYPVHLNSV